MSNPTNRPKKCAGCKKVPAADVKLTSKGYCPACAEKRRPVPAARQLERRCAACGAVKAASEFGTYGSGLCRKCAPRRRQLGVRRIVSGGLVSRNRRRS